MNAQLTPDDLAHIRATYQTYSRHFRWALFSIIIGTAVGIGLAFIVGGATWTNPLLWLGFVYGAAVLSIDYSKESSATREFFRAPVTLAKELRRRVKAVADGHRSLKERFGK